MKNPQIFGESEHPFDIVGCSPRTPGKAFTPEITAELIAVMGKDGLRFNPNNPREIVDSCGNFIAPVMKSAADTIRCLVDIAGDFGE